MSWSKSLRISAHQQLMKFGIDTRRLRRDRKLLEQVVIPEIVRDQRYQDILFVGCTWYTAHYPKMFRQKRFFTLEIDPAQARFGGERHIVDSCENMRLHFEPNSLDCILFNGVYGFGLNDRDAIDRSFKAIHEVIKPSGLFVFGWNDLPDTTPVPIAEIKALKQITPVEFPPLNASVYESDPGNRHRFHFYTKVEPV